MGDLNLAIDLHNKNEFEKAEPLYLKHLEENPNDANANNLIGLLYSQTKQFDKSEKYLKKAVELDENINYIENLAVCYYMQKRYQEAMPYFEKILEKVPKDLARIRDFAKLAKDANQWEYAINFYSRSYEIDKRDHIALNNIGLGYEELKQFDKAKGYYERSIRLKPNYHAFHNLGVWYRRAGNPKQSIVYLKRALTLNPNNKDTAVSLGMSYLAIKDIENGQKYYRYRLPNIKNEWDGEKHPDKKLFIYADGGRGDQLMFCRYIPFLKDYFKEIKFSVYDELKEIFQQNYIDINIEAKSEKDIFEPHDYMVNPIDLPQKLGMNFDSIPYAQGYLKADEQKAEKYKKEFFDNNKVKVGIFWQGNLKVFPYRSMKLAEMSKLFELTNCQFYSCQKGDGIEQLKDYNNIIDLGSTFNDYTDTAAALKNLDILVTIDSSILHLAGAMGVKTYLLLPVASEWRWFEDTKTTPWYDSVEIFKQEKLYDWQPPVDKVFSRLNELSDKQN